jgi:hypothetical protein
VSVDPDFSKLDSFHVTTDHPRMTRREWENTYLEAWRTFYTKENMIASLQRFTLPERRKLLLSYLFWARWSFAAERVHHMIAGFYRVRSYQDRSPSAPPLSYARFVFQDSLRIARYVPLLLSELRCFQEIVFAVEYAPRLRARRAALIERARALAARLVGRPEAGLATIQETNTRSRPAEREGAPARVHAPVPPPAE